MLKDKKKDELIEINYTKEAEIQRLLSITNAQNEALEKIECAIEFGGLFNFLFKILVLPLFVTKEVKTLNNYYLKFIKSNKMKFSKQELKKAFQMANAFEKDNLGVNIYIKAVEGVLKVKICSNCGDSIVKRTHSDFQRRILKECFAIDPKILGAVKFKSGKYSNGGYWEKDVLTMPYTSIEKVLKEMKKDLSRFKNQKLVSQLPLLKDDIKTLEMYRDVRLNDFDGLEDINEPIQFVKVDDSTEVSKVAAPPKVEDTKTKTTETSKAEIETDEQEKQPVKDVEEIVQDAIETDEQEKAENAEKNGTNGIDFDVIEAARMRENEMKWAEIGEYFGLSESTVRSRVKKYKEKNKAE